MSGLICPPCPHRGNEGHGLTHCAECCFVLVVEKLERLQADGGITVHDADEVRTFASFLTETKGLPKTGGTEDEVWARRIAYARHYPDDFERAYPDLYRATVERMERES